MTQAPRGQLWELCELVQACEACGRGPARRIIFTVNPQMLAPRRIWRPCGPAVGELLLWDVLILLAPAP